MSVLAGQGGRGLRDRVTYGGTSPCRVYFYGARTSVRSPWGGDTARRRFIGGGRGRFLS